MKIESLQRCLERIKSKIPDDVNQFLSDLDRQDIIILNLQRSVQLCVDIVQEFCEDVDFGER